MNDAFNAFQAISHKMAEACISKRFDSGKRRATDSGFGCWRPLLGPGGR